MSDQSSPPNGGAAAAPRLQTVDALRGLAAALAVVWYHLTFGDPKFLAPGVFQSTGRYGGVGGVYAFFVISGFIIPWALNRASYGHRNLFRFMAKRMTRLDPPYLVSIAFILALGVIARPIPGFHWHPRHVPLRQLLAHLGYANALLGYRWMNDVYWTLGIELQYYLLLALVFPIAARLPDRSQWLVPGMFIVATGFRARGSAATRCMTIDSSNRRLRDRVSHLSLPRRTRRPASIPVLAGPGDHRGLGAARRLGGGRALGRRRVDDRVRTAARPAADVARRAVLLALPVS